MMKKSWKNRKGVSPVIATILMVAITVVLAAVLYVMVMGFGGGESTATGALTYSKNNAGYTITMSSISKNNVPISDTALIITPAAGVVRTDGPALGDALTSSLAGATYVTAGDYATVTIANPGTYTISLLYVTTGNNIATMTFTIPST